MIVDIGGELQMWQLYHGGIVVSRSIKTAGDECDEAISRYIRKNTI